jgi:gas vesicle protein
MAQNNGMLKGLIIGVLAGGAVGALIALLYAPKSGKELRADIKERADDFMEGAEEAMSAAKSRAGDIVSEAKKRSDQLITDAKRKADTSGARGKSAAVVEEGQKIKNAVKAGFDAYKDERRRS